MKGTARIFKRNRISYSGEGSKKIFYGILESFRQKGAEIRNNAVIYTRYRFLKDTHKTIHWKGMVADIDFYPSGLSAEINHKRNRMSSHCTGFWSLDDERSSGLTYVELKKTDLFMQVFSSFFSSNGIPIDDQHRTKSPERYILDKERENKHVHGGPVSIEELNAWVNCNTENYFSEYNRKSAEGELIVSGEEVYFYSYRMGHRLCRGTAIHNINNMWWVVSGGMLHNIACFNLFRRNQNLPLRNPELVRSAVGRIDRMVEEFAKQRRFAEAMAAQGNLMKATEKLKAFEKEKTVA